MTQYCEDTSAAVQEVQLNLIRQASVPLRLELVSQMTETVQALALSGIQQHHPQSTPQQQKRLLADILLGKALAKQVYGPALNRE